VLPLAALQRLVSQLASILLKLGTPVADALRTETTLRSGQQQSL
jgi:hypothetical protein